MKQKRLVHAIGASLALSGWQAAVNATPISFITTGAAQSWLVPSSGTYRITAIGAQGGSGTDTSGGRGAEIYGDFTLTQNETLTIYVGGAGGSAAAGGGGGGSFVIRTGNVALVVAGGGGGGGWKGTNGKAASLLAAGTAGNPGSAGGTAGRGGEGDGGNYGGGGGGGFSGNGGNALGGGAGGLGYPTLAGGLGNNGGAGGNGDGGFGGGGGAGLNGGGGGGGYSGGGGGVGGGIMGFIGGGGGGGGGSFIFSGATNTSQTTTSRTGDGLVSIEAQSVGGSEVPEIDALAGTGGLTLVGFGVALIQERRRRPG